MTVPRDTEHPLLLSNNRHQQKTIGYNCCDFLELESVDSVDFLEKKNNSIISWSLFYHFSLPTRQTSLSLQRPYHKSGRKLGRIEAEMHQKRLDDAEAGWDTHNVKGVYSALCSLMILIFATSNQVENKATVDDLCGNMSCIACGVPYINKVRAQG